MPPIGSLSGGTPPLAHAFLAAWKTSQQSEFYGGVGFQWCAVRLLFASRTPLTPCTLTLFARHGLWPTKFDDARIGATPAQGCRSLERAVRSSLRRSARSGYDDARIRAVVPSQMGGPTPVRFTDVGRSRPFWAGRLGATELIVSQLARAVQDHV